MDRELLLEIGCEEIPASWLPSLTNQVGEVLAAQLRERRLPAETPVETFSTPRRLMVRIARIPERQTDFEEVVTGPPVGAPQAAVAGFAAKQGVDPSTLERIDTPKGTYLAFRKRLRGKAAVDVLPDVLGGTLRGLSFPKSMHWDAMLEDGKGELLFGRPIRWILYTYGGRVVPFTITRTPAAQSSQVQDITTGASTYGHRFLTTSGRAGRSIKVRSFDDYRNRLLENFVIIERSERHDKIARELDAKAQRLHGRVSRVVRQDSGLLEEVPDLVEYPAVIAGTFAREFLDLPEEVLTTTLIHHQHYFPIEGEDGKLKEAFLAVINIEPDNERTIARNAERVVTARLRDARFFWEADRKAMLESRIERLSTLVFHKKLGSYKDKASRIETLARWIAKEAFGASDNVSNDAALAARLAKTDLATDMVREFPELQGVMGGVYARSEGQPEEVWKAVYYHYLPHGVEADAPPTRAHLGRAALTWAAVSLADKLDTLVGLFLKADERPTGSRDPYGLRRAGHGVVKTLVDLEALTGVTARPALRPLIEQAKEQFGLRPVMTESDNQFLMFLMDRLRHLMETRGLEFEEIQVATGYIDRVQNTNLADLVDRAQECKKYVGTEVLAKAAEAFTRAKKIVFQEWGESERDRLGEVSVLQEPAEIALRAALERVRSEVKAALTTKRPARALEAIASVQPDVEKFFNEVRVVVPDQNLKNARLSLLADFRDAVNEFGDLTVIAAKQA